MFNLVFDWKYFEFLNKKSPNHQNINGIMMTPQQQKQSRKLFQEKVNFDWFNFRFSIFFKFYKLSHYLDLIELQISKQISIKANTFFQAMTSQDEVQEHVLKTCSAVKSLRKNIRDLDQNVVLKSMKLLQMIKVRSKYSKLLAKVIKKRFKNKIFILSIVLR